MLAKAILAVNGMGESAREKLADTPSGEFLIQVLGTLVQYERALIQLRVLACLAAARQRGRIDGRPQAITGETLDAISSPRSTW